MPVEPGLEEDRFRGLCFEGRPRLKRPVRPRHKPANGAAAPAVLPQSAVQHVPDDAARFLRFLLDRCGVGAARYRLWPLYRRLNVCLHALGARSPAQAHELLEAEPQRWPLALESLLIGTTEFFRDQAVFDELRWRALPALLERRGASGLDVWSAGCSDGAELYSVAVLLAEAGALDRSRLLGTDCRAGAIERAREARYHAGAFDAAPAELRHKYFREDAGWIVPDEALRRAVAWEVGDILRGRPAHSLDLVLCRNVAIYLEPAAGNELWAGLVHALRPGGVLVVGRAERHNCQALRQISRCIYLKTPEPHHAGFTGPSPVTTERLTR